MRDSSKYKNDYSPSLQGGGGGERALREKTSEALQMIVHYVWRGESFDSIQRLYEILNKADM